MKGALQTKKTTSPVTSASNADYQSLHQEIANLKSETKLLQNIIHKQNKLIQKHVYHKSIQDKRVLFSPSRYLYPLKRKSEHSNSYSKKMVTRLRDRKRFNSCSLSPINFRTDNDECLIINDENDILNSNFSLSGDDDDHDDDNENHGNKLGDEEVDGSISTESILDYLQSDIITKSSSLLKPKSKSNATENDDDDDIGDSDMEEPSEADKSFVYDEDAVPGSFHDIYLHEPLRAPATTDVINVKKHSKLNINRRVSFIEPGILSNKNKLHHTAISSQPLLTLEEGCTRANDIEQSQLKLQSQSQPKTQSHSPYVPSLEFSTSSVFGSSSSISPQSGESGVTDRVSPLSPPLYYPSQHSNTSTVALTNTGTSNISSGAGNSGGNNPISSTNNNDTRTVKDNVDSLGLPTWFYTLPIDYIRSDMNIWDTLVKFYGWKRVPGYKLINFLYLPPALVGVRKKDIIHKLKENKDYFTSEHAVKSFVLNKISIHKCGRK